MCDFISFKISTGSYDTFLNVNLIQFKKIEQGNYSRKTIESLLKEQEDIEEGIFQKFNFGHNPYKIVKVYIKRAKRQLEFLIYCPQDRHTFRK